VLEELIEEGSEAFGSILEKLLNAAMQLERAEFIQAEPYERTEARRGYANGYKDKTLKTRVGELKLQIPQVRGISFYPQSLEKGCRSEKALKLAIAEMYVMGVSTRKVSEITEQLCGTEISATQVSRLSEVLDEELKKFRQRDLGTYSVIWLDAHYEKVRVSGSVRELAVLKAIGLSPFGKREILGVSISLSEAEVHWRQFLEDLQKRGLKGVRLIISDDHAGLRTARRAVYPSVRWQRCQFHLSQNAQHYARSREERREIAQEVRDIFNSPTREDAEAMLKRKVQSWSEKNPRLSEWMETNLVEGFSVFDFPRSAQRKLRTNNQVENLNKQIRRRTRVVGIFPNEDSALRLITAVLQEIHEEWIIGKQYINLARWKTPGGEREPIKEQTLKAIV
jgi:transposase-like protein